MKRLTKDEFMRIKKGTSLTIRLDSYKNLKNAQTYANRLSLREEQPITTQSDTKKLTLTITKL